MKNEFRKTTQDLLPVGHKPTPVGQYDIYPAFPINDGKIGVGYEALAERIARHERIVIDGFIGVLWEEFRAKLEHTLVTIITLKADVELVPKGGLNRYVMKTQRVVDIRSEEAKKKYLESTKIRSAKYFD